MPATRAQLVTGPAKIVRSSGVTYTKDDVQINILQTTIPHGTMAHGHIFETADSATVEATFTPDGRWNAAAIAFLWPYLNFTRGASIFTASDVPCVFHGADTGMHTIHASALKTMPSIFLSAGKSMVGPVTVVGVRRAGIAWSTADSLYAAATNGSTFADATYLREDMVVQDWTGAWGDQTGLTAIKTQDGWTIDFDLQVEPIMTDEGGILDYKYVSLQVMARCSPVEATLANIMAGLFVQGTGASRGRRLCKALAAVDDLVITGTADAGAIITLKHAGLKTAGFRFGSAVLREGEIGFVAGRPFSAGATAPIVTLAAST